MPMYVKDGGDWRQLDTSGDNPDQLYCRDSTSFTNKTVLNGYVKTGGVWKEFYNIFLTTDFQTFTDTTQQLFERVPALANKIHIQKAVGAGGGGGGGLDYDQAGFEDGGGGGASGAFISDMVFTVTGGEILTFNIGAGGTGGNGVGEPPTNTQGTTGGATTLSGATTGPIFTLNGGSGAVSTGGRVSAPASVAGVAGTRTVISGVGSGTTTDGLNITTFTSGPRASFNQQGDGTNGTNGVRYSGDNANGVGSSGGASFVNLAGTAGAGGDAGNGGAPESGQFGKSGSQGGGGGGGGTEQGAPGGSGGDGLVQFRFLRI